MIKLTKEQLGERKRILRFLEGSDAKLISICSDEFYGVEGGRCTPWANSMMCVWCMPVSWEPMMICFSVGKERFTHNCLEIGRACMVSHVPESRYEEAVQTFGKKSGWDGKKPSPIDYAGLGFIGEIYALSDVGDHTLVTMKVQNMKLFNNA